MGDLFFLSICPFLFCSLKLNKVSVNTEVCRTEQENLFIHFSFLQPPVYLSALLFDWHLQNSLLSDTILGKHKDLEMYMHKVASARTRFPGKEGRRNLPGTAHTERMVIHIN